MSPDVSPIRPTSKAPERVYCGNAIAFAPQASLYVPSSLLNHQAAMLLTRRVILTLAFFAFTFEGITTVMGAVLSNTVDPMLVMEYMDYGSLYDLLRNETMYAGGEIILQTVRDIVQGVQFLHASKPPILHGDLKAKNILVDSRFRAKVADFGFSHIHKQKTNTLQGTPFFMAPEYLSRRSEYTAECDIYSVSTF